MPNNKSPSAASADLLPGAGFQKMARQPAHTFDLLCRLHPSYKADIDDLARDIGLPADELFELAESLETGYGVMVLPHEHRDGEYVTVRPSKWPRTERLCRTWWNGQLDPIAGMAPTWPVIEMKPDKSLRARVA